MASAAVLLLQLLLISMASASHHYGGTESFTYKGRNPDGSYRVEIRSKSTYDGCHHGHRWRCFGPNCHTLTSQRGNIDSSRNTQQYSNLWCESEVVSTITVSNDRPFQRRSLSCCWVRNRNGLGSWSLMTHIDLGTRSDTRQPNRSPDVGILPFLRVPMNCPRTYKIMAFDPDGDRVRCRYGNIRLWECTRCSMPSGFHLDQDTCTLTYQSTTSHISVMGFEMVVEDFPQRHFTVTYADGTQSSRAPLSSVIQTTTTAPSTTSLLSPTTGTQYSSALLSSVSQTTMTTPSITSLLSTTTTTAAAIVFGAPLSKLPLQFSLLVDLPAPSCVAGDYIPVFINPTPQDGARIQAQVNREVEIEIKANARNAVIENVIMSGPFNSSKHMTTNGEFIIRWTPQQFDLGSHYAICFAVEAKQNGRIYQSEMRCVLVDVRNEEVISHVVCGQSSMNVTVEKASFRGLNENHLQLSDPTNVECSLVTHSNSTHVIAVIPLSACGTQIEEDDDNLLFKNEITTIDDHQDLITRKHLLEVQFYCQYPKRGNVTLSFTAHRRTVTVWDRGFGTFTYQFEFYPNNQFRTLIDPNSYPLDYDLGSRIFMQIEAVSNMNNTELFVESCRAAPYDNPNYRPVYSLIENGCTVDQTVLVHSRSDNKQFRFSVEAFKFIGLHQQVYISCSVMMCEAGNPNTRCSRGCVSSTQTSHHRRRREAGIESAIESVPHMVSQGPVRLRRAAEVGETTVIWNLNLNVVFIAGCLLAAVGMVCGVILHKTRSSKV